jgi:hypothetical protein
MLRETQHEVARSVGTLTFSPGKDGKVPPLEAADMLAWHMNQRASWKRPDDPMWKYIDQPKMYKHPITPAFLIDYVKRMNVAFGDLPPYPEPPRPSKKPQR